MFNHMPGAYPKCYFAHARRLPAEDRDKDNSAQAQHSKARYVAAPVLWAGGPYEHATAATSSFASNDTPYQLQFHTCIMLWDTTQWKSPNLAELWSVLTPFALSEYVSRCISYSHSTFPCMDTICNSVIHFGLLLRSSLFPLSLTPLRSLQVFRATYMSLLVWSVNPLHRGVWTQDFIVDASRI